MRMRKECQLSVSIQHFHLSLSQLHPRPQLNCFGVWAISGHFHLRFKDLKGYRVISKLWPEGWKFLALCLCGRKAWAPAWFGSNYEAPAGSQIHKRNSIARLRGKRRTRSVSPTHIFSMTAFCTIKTEGLETPQLFSWLLCSLLSSFEVHSWLYLDIRRESEHGSKGHEVCAEVTGFFMHRQF